MPSPSAPLSLQEKAALVVRGLLLVGLVVLAAVAIVGRDAPLREGQEAPVVHAQSYDGRTWDLSLFAGQPVFVNFWGSWCPPCIAELPDLVAAHAQHGDEVAFVGLAVDSPPADVFATIRRFDIRYPIAATDGATVGAWGAAALPSSYLLDAEHRVVWSGAGQLTARDLAALFETVLPRAAAPRAP